MDVFNIEIYKALLILNNYPENEAIVKLEEIKPGLYEMSDNLLSRLENVPEMSKKEEDEYMREEMNKPAIKDLVKLLSDPSFSSKIDGNSLLKKEFDELMALMDKEAEDEEDLPSDGEECTFVIGGAV